MSVAAGSAPRSRLAGLVLLLSVLGTLVSAYLVYEHFTSSQSFACPETGAINCVKVTTSTYATVLGIPVAVLGLAFWIAMTALAWPSLWDRRSLDGVRLAASGLGVVFVVYLIWVELFRVDAICLWCTAVHVVTFAVFATLVMHTAVRPRVAAA